VAATLTEAAHLTYVRARPRWAAATLKASLALFITDVSVIFSDTIANDRPVGNWLIPLYALSSNLPAGVLPVADFNAVVDGIYRLCMAGAAQLSATLITAPQGAALLAAWNARIGP